MGKTYFKVGFSTNNVILYYRLLWWSVVKWRSLSYCHLRLLWILFLHFLQDHEQLLRNIRVCLLQNHFQLCLLLHISHLLFILFSWGYLAVANEHSKPNQVGVWFILDRFRLKFLESSSNKDATKPDPWIPIVIPNSMPFRKNYVLLRLIRLGKWWIVLLVWLHLDLMWLHLDDVSGSILLRLIMMLVWTCIKPT